jgi:hypothetical protein
MEMEWSALHLVRGCDPYFTPDKAGALVTPAGRFALSRDRREDLRGFMGPRTVQLQKVIANTPERWGQLIPGGRRGGCRVPRATPVEIERDAPVPDTYKMPGHELGEINDQLGRHDLGSVFVISERKEATRRLTWTLTNSPDVRTMLL